MSAPSNTGGFPSAPLSTPGTSSQPIKNPASEYSGSSTLWSTIPGLGSAVKPLEATPRSVSTTGPPPTSIGARPSLRKAPPLAFDAAFTANVLPSRAIGAAPKTAGAAPANWHNVLDKRGAITTAASDDSGSALASASWSRYGSAGAPQSFKDTNTTVAGTKGTAVHFTQTEKYHTSAAPAPAPPPSPTPAPAPASATATAPTATLPHTAPLPQTGFHTFSDRTDSDKEGSTCDAFTDPTSSEASMGQTELGAPTWMEATNPRSLRHSLQDPRAEWEEPFAGALHALSTLIPTQYVMPFGTKVVNIKTDFPLNIHVSIREKKYAAIEKVSERISDVYEARHSPNEKVIFLFSVNGSKKFCGLAEMSGPWDTSDVIHGWEESSQSANVKGTIPVKWIYAKDVAYQHFAHIKQLHNGHPVGNMWNGMNFPSETGRQVIEQYVVTPSTSSTLGYPKNYPENFGIINPRANDGSSETRSSVSQRSRGSFVGRGAPRGGRGMSRGGLNVAKWRPQSSDTGSATRKHLEDDPTPVPANAGRVFSKDNHFAANQMASTERNKTTFSMEDLKNAPVAGNVVPLPGEPVTFVMGHDGQLMVIPKAKEPGQPSNTMGQKSSVFDDNLAHNPRFPPANPSFDRDDLGPYGRGDRNGTAHRPPHDTQSSYATRPRHMGHGHSPSAAILHQAAIFAAQQDALLRNPYPSAPYETSWDYHAQQMASLGFQNNGPHYSRLRASHDNHISDSNEDDYDSLQTPTHRPPPHGTRHEPNDDDIPATYHSVQGWQSEVVQGMGHLQLKALFFTLAAEQHVLEYQSMQPAATRRATEIMRARMARIVGLKREVYDELHFIGHPLFDNQHDHQDLNLYQEPNLHGYGTQQRISPIRDENGRPLPSASETSRSPPETWNTQFRPFTQSNAHHQQHSTQSTASMMSGGVQLGERRPPSG